MHFLKISFLREAKVLFSWPNFRFFLLLFSCQQLKFQSHWQIVYVSISPPKWVSVCFKIYFQWNYRFWLKPTSIFLNAAHDPCFCDGTVLFVVYFNLYLIPAKAMPPLPVLPSFVLKWRHYSPRFPGPNSNYSISGKCLRSAITTPLAFPIFTRCGR